MAYQDITLAQRRPDYISGIPSEFFATETNRFFYELGYRTSIFQRLRGTGASAVVDTRYNFEKGSGMTTSYTRRQDLDPENYIEIGTADISTTRERLAEDYTSFTAQYIGKQTFFVGQTVATIASAYGSIINAGRYQLARWLQRFVDCRFFKAIAEGYDFNAAGKMPYGCRMCVGHDVDFPYYDDTPLIELLKNTIPQDLSANQEYEQWSMTPTHLRYLYKSAISNKYGADEIQPAELEMGQLIDSPSFYLLVDSDAAMALKSNAEFREVVYSVGRDLGAGHGSALRRSLYLGRFNNLEIYEIPELQQLKVKGSFFNMNTPSEKRVSISILLGAGALGEAIGQMREFNPEDENDPHTDTQYHTLQFVHGVSSLKFPVHKPLLEQNKGNGDPIGANGEKIEQGIMFSFTVNHKLGNWHADA